MITMVRKIGSVTAACLSLLWVSTLSAEGYSSPTCPDSCHSCGDAIWVGGEFLFWRPCFSMQEWTSVLDETEVTNGNTTIITANFDNKYFQNAWEPGFRIRAGLDKFASCLDLSFSYTYMQGKDRRTALLPGSFLNNGTSTDHFRYQTFDILLHRTCALNCCHTITPYFGLEGLKFDQWFDIQFASATLSSTTKTRVDGWQEALGLKFGAHYDWQLYSCLSFFFDGSFSILGGGQDLKQQTISFDGVNTTSSTNHANTSVCIPGFHIQTGLTYHGCLCSRPYYLTLGYEFVDWFNIQQVRRGEITSTLVTTVNSQLAQRVGFHGLFVGLGFQF